MSREMKQSGIPWIGDIPKDWTVCFIKQIMRNKSIKGYPDEMVLSLYRDYGVVPKNSRDDNHNVTSEDTSSYKFVEVGDFVINKMKAWQGSMAVSDYQGIISPAYYICRFINDDIDRKYIHYLLRNDTYKAEYMRLSSGMRVGQWDLSIDDFLRIKMVLPSLSEQQKIASFLDRKSAEVDEMIALQEKIIEELKAYKQSVITEAVTKGLNLEVPMKHSGIEWIGEIPEHWEVIPHKRVMRKIKEIQEHYNGENILSLTMKGVIVRDLEAGGKMPATFDGYQRVYPNNLLQCLFDIDVTPRCVGLVKEYGLTSPAYSQFELFPNAYAPYYDYLLRYMDDIKAMLHLSKNLRSSLTETDFGAILTCVPPISEQQAIADYLDIKCTEIDSLINIKLSKIDSLKEYKKSIIYEYVTGKKEVIE